MCIISIWLDWSTTIVYTNKVPTNSCFSVCVCVTVSLIGAWLILVVIIIIVVVYCKSNSRWPSRRMAQSTTYNAPSPQLSLPDKEKVQAGLIGQPCGQHSSYTFYKAFSYLDRATQTKRVLMLGEFFFMKISPHDDPCIGELQLLWEDRQRNQLLSSTRLYFLPEQTPGGRQSHHGQVSALPLFNY